MMLNPNIPEAVRAVASDGTQLRYALMELSAQYKDAIALGRGDPDLATPPHIIAAAQDAIRQQRTAPLPIAGMPDLRAAIAHKFRQSGLNPKGISSLSPGLRVRELPWERGAEILLP